MSSAGTHISCTSLSFSWPAGSEVLTGFDLAVGPGRTGLIGLNGCGKSTLLRLIAGELTPASGTIRIRGELGHLPPSVVLDTALRVDEVLGVERTAADRGAGGVRGGADRGQPRRAVPGVDRDHPVAPARRRAAGHDGGGGAPGLLRPAPGPRSEEKATEAVRYPA